ncbi:di-trans,poly-cis-decaprenylcistransferase [candidate division Kazan bacterium RIFCSPHIGHO2_01_FULL_49_10]|uniref:Isoprenyl transferase n=1 Tax=candidate division Kazan bacterium RIFCSPLOWO2_01_FULL_48_13 TaxID=1798539 RepID=A0A1F4PNR0_UNCK3|nr:MAG: di-trans,poly-cis-decaprenylcistransferase [candidate division Kazan bacterium RIFCSPHIGHO2_01_FULL_49_10]OGB85321.1 MAG: di-trans,poly-cis-decaprenylcistransferase [candidate division Kazan bacterium RIFCSPLOWO2_01_FULL_48_13]
MAKSQINHLAVIMDGNRRWAKKKGRPVSAGHAAGVKALDKMAKACKKLGIHYVTVYAFSTENWQRNKTEVRAMLKLLEKTIQEYTDQMDRERVGLKVIGRVKDFPKSLQSAIDKSVNKLKAHRRDILTVALSYGGRDEISRAAAKASRAGRIDEKSLAAHLDTAGLPDPDLIIRTGGQMRLSNFLPWQGVYSELYFTNTLWPDFGEKDLKKAIREYTRRQRNFGK